MASELKDEKLDFWIKNNYNVLMSGLHGIGKTAAIKAAFNRSGLRWKYFSAATLDPWVDLVGVPKEVTDENGISYLDLVRPKEFQYDEIDAVFFDEFNRSHKKVRNAVMELLQFKSINGKKFNNLRIVWAAINPADEDEYDVEKLDPAQEDRFHVRVEVPYKPVNSYFVDKYGVELSKSAISWWNELSEAEKRKVSPRRLDYALDIYQNNGDLRDVLPETCGVNKLLQTIKVGPISSLLEKLYKNANVEEARKFLADENNLQSSLEWINKSVKNKTGGNPKKDFFIPLFPLERLSQMAVKEAAFLDYIIEAASYTPVYVQVLNDIVGANLNKTVVTKLLNKTKKNETLKQLLDATKDEVLIQAEPIDVGKKPDAIFYAKKDYSNDFDAWLKKCSKQPLVFNRTTPDRAAFMVEISKQIPPILTVSQALESLDLLQHVAVASQVGTITKKTEFSKFMGIVNHCISEIARGTNKDWNHIYERYFIKRLSPLYNKIVSSKVLAERLLCPTQPIEQAAKIKVIQATP